MKLLEFFSRNKNLIKESDFNGKTIINVDIQPEYEKWINFNLSNWVSFLNNNSNNNLIIFLYNGYDTLGMIGESEYINWLLELGVDDSVIDDAIFYDKGYAFFRFCMDNDIYEDNIVSLVKFMIKHNINDSRDIDEEMWDSYMVETNHDAQDVRDLLEYAGDMINIPDLMDFLINYSNIVLLGGGLDECLKEVEIALMSLDKKYEIIEKYTY